MEEGPPPPDDPAESSTAAQHHRARGSTRSSISSGSILSTRSLHSVDISTVTENSREYPNASYYMPCDQQEQDRLSILHQVWISALGGSLTSAPVTAAAQRILDIGTGPGDWAVAISRRFPFAEVVALDQTVWDVEAVERGQLGEGEESKVIWAIDDVDIWGVDEELGVEKAMGRIDLGEPARSQQEGPRSDPNILSTPHGTAGEGSTMPTGKSKQPISDPPPTPGINPSVLSSAPEIGWNFSEPFDFIHLRGLKGSFTSWPDVYAECYRNLAPGGYIEVCDYDLRMPDDPMPYGKPSSEASSPSSDIETSAPETQGRSMPHTRKLYKSTIYAAYKSGRPMGSAHLHPTLLSDAGFKDVRTTYVNVPVGIWSQEEEQKRIGKMFLVCLMEGIEATCLRLLTKVGDEERIWPIEEVRDSFEKSRQELLDWGLKERLEEGEAGWCAQFKWVIGRKSRAG